MTTLLISTINSKSRYAQFRVNTTGNSYYIFYIELLGIEYTQAQPNNKTATIEVTAYKYNNSEDNIIIGELNGKTTLYTNMDIERSTSQFLVGSGNSAIQLDFVPGFLQYGVIYINMQMVEEA